jgi:hypothetical protein
MSVPKFNPKEIKASAPGEMPVFDFPVTPKEGYLATYKRKPLWLNMYGYEVARFSPKVNPDNVARAFVYDGSGMTKEEGGGKDMFGLEWEYVPTVGGSMIRPGKPLMSDANEWYEKLQWPDVESWDWEGCAKVNKNFLSKEKVNQVMLMNGWYERLISFMDFEGAIMAMVDEEQTDAVKELFYKLSDLYIQILDKYVTYFPDVEVYCIHDDWGSQKETFFSPDVVAELIVGPMKKVTDFLHSKGKYCDLHSCGQILKQVPNMIAAGWDSWNPQPMNDFKKIYELYGDKIIIGAMPDDVGSLKSVSEDEQRARAREFARMYCKPQKPTTLNYGANAFVTPAFLEELYKESRTIYGGK